LLLCGLLLAACGGDDTASPAQPAGSATPTGPGLQAFLVASQVLVGNQRLPVGVSDHNTPVNDAQVHVRAFAIAGTSAQLRGESDAPFKGMNLNGRGLYIASFVFDAPGQWLAEITAARPDGSSSVARIPFRVSLKGLVPGVGEPAPRSNNQTLQDVPDASYIDSGSPPDDMHLLSIADAIDQHRPALVVFATPAFCSSATCGPQVRAVQALEPAYRSRLAFIHVEIYHDFNPDPSKRQRTPTVLEWHLQTEPWVFLIDGSGVIRAEFEAVTASDDLQAAIDQMLAAA
jgi:hypothetical protein